MLAAKYQTLITQVKIDDFFFILVRVYNICNHSRKYKMFAHHYTAKRQIRIIKRNRPRSYLNDCLKNILPSI